MLCAHYDASGTLLLETVELEPRCGEDFCDLCGDCLRCFDGDRCPETDDGEHRWVVYSKGDEA